jgi:erythromycin esterase
MKSIAQAAFCLLGALLLANSSYAQDSLQVVTAWLKHNAVPIKYLDAENNFSDLKPLKKTLKDVRVIGLGEGTHGTREFFKIKHRLLTFLVTEMNFTAFVLESSYSACQPINDYILLGKGDRATVLTGQGYMAWDTEEFAAMLDWLKAYNQQVPEEKKVRFYGLDLCFNGIGRERVMAFLQKHAPAKVGATEALFRVLAREEDKWPFRLNQSSLQQTIGPLLELVTYFKTQKDQLIAVSSPGEWEKVFQHVRIMEQWLLANLKDPPPGLASPKLERYQYLGPNALYLIDKEKPGTKFMIWAHNFHIGNNAKERTLGFQLRQRLGPAYYALGLDCSQGTFQSRVMLPDSTWGELKADTLLPAPKSVAWYLTQAKKGNLFIDLRAPASNPVVEKWLATPRRFVDGTWRYRGAKENYVILKPKDFYNGILFIERSTPAHPTQNARHRSANGIGF